MLRYCGVINSSVCGCFLNYSQLHSISTFKCVYALPGFGIYSHRVLRFFFLVWMWLIFTLHFSQESQDLTRNPRVQIWFNNWKKQTRWANVDFMMLNWGHLQGGYEGDLWLGLTLPWPSEDRWHTTKLSIMLTKIIFPRISVATETCYI